MKIGFIGCGNMARAIISGIIASKMAQPGEIMASARSAETLGAAHAKLGIMVGTNCETAEYADILVLAIKPQVFDGVLEEICTSVRPESIVISIAPGKTLSHIGQMLGDPACKKRKLVRAMPNTPAMVGEGMTGYCSTSELTGKDLELVREIFDSFGECAMVSEHLLDVVTGVSGSSPAYVFMMIEAMADGAVAEGMPRNLAYRFAAQAVLGSAKLALQSGMHPGELKDMVCSPGGTTIEAVGMLEEKGFRSALIEAERACIRKGRGL